LPGSFNPEGHGHHSSDVLLDCAGVVGAAVTGLLAHRDVGPGRTLSATALQVVRSESTLRRLANRWDWTERLQTFDRAVLQKVAVDAGIS